MLAQCERRGRRGDDGAMWDEGSVERAMWAMEDGNIAVNNSTFLNREHFCLKHLLFSTCCVIIYIYQRKEIQFGDLHARNRRILHTRRDRKHSQDYRRLCNQNVKKEKDARVQGRRFLESKQDRILDSYGKTKEYSRGSTKGQIKPALSWQKKINNPVALGQLGQPWKSFPNAPWNSLPIYSIALKRRKVKLYKTWAADRKMSMPMSKNDPNNQHLATQEYALAKTCVWCEEEKPLSQYYKPKEGESILRTAFCHPCYSKLNLKVRNHNKRAPGKLTISMWLKILEASEGYCFYCKEHKGVAHLSIEHVVPIGEMGGTNDIENIVAACKKCNNSKGDRTLEEWQRVQEAKRLLVVLQTKLGLSRYETINQAIFALAEKEGMSSQSNKEVER